MTILLGVLRCVAVAVFATMATAQAAASSIVTVVTSFPASLYEPFRDAFEATHPEHALRIINRRTASALTAITDDRQGPIDVFWASSPDAFDRLAQDGYLENLDRVDVAPIPVIGGFPLDDPEGRYVGFAISGFGVVVSEPYLDARGLAVPQSTADLALSQYAGHIGLSAPSRSGTSHVMIEALLQQEGWEEGWALWMEIGGNLSTVTARSYSVIEGVSRGRYGLGLSVDFLGRAESGVEPHGTGFAYLSDSVFLPANVGILNGTQNRDGALAFVDFLLSERGQNLLLSPQIQRLPIDRNLYRSHPDLFDPFEKELNRDSDFVFNAQLSSRRYDVVNVLFDIAITDRLYELQQGWSALHAAEAALADRDASHARVLLEQARSQLSAMPLSGDQADAGEWLSSFKTHSPGVLVSAEQAAIEAEWREHFATSYRQAMALIQKALEVLTPDGAALL